MKLNKIIKLDVLIKKINSGCIRKEKLFSHYMFAALQFDKGQLARYISFKMFITSTSYKINEQDREQINLIIFKKSTEMQSTMIIGQGGVIL